MIAILKLGYVWYALKDMEDAAMVMAILAKGVEVEFKNDEYVPVKFEGSLKTSLELEFSEGAATEKL